ncbi:beta-ketoacyl synthase N-terminal-like domain-containing protein [[Empedobacter] haloabium]|uniref:Beta-ketoacyl synthase N-terminal-like domain-containing protein n=1 Tax=[Empedobacter] haloabium TaxID=592317 RepID=A0ABZ1UQB0_9BURK
MSALVHEPLAVVGMACTLPGAPDYQAYWDALADGAAALRPDLAYAELFDPARYGVSEQEARIMDPQCRQFLMLAEAAFADAGYLRGQGMGRVGVVAAQACNGTYHDYLATLAARGHIAPLPALLENVNRGSDFLATRVSYTFDLNGPAFNLQSGCSSSLVAVSEACHLLWSGRCDAVLAGGVAITFPLDAGYEYQPGSIYSEGGVCRPFDARADGTVPASGGGAVLIKPLAHALRDGDSIHALVRAAGVNNDGARKVSFAAPSSDGQLALLRETYAASGVAPAQLAFVECHATGTVVGDPIEVRALRRLVESYPPAQPHRPILLGSVKGHIGHLFWSSGIASLVKAVLALERGYYPGTANLDTPNPLLKLDDSPFAVAATGSVLDFAERDCCGVSSMGVGGTNAHLILQRYQGQPGSRARLPAPDWRLRRFSLVPEKLGEGMAVAAASASSTAPPGEAQLCAAIVALYEEALGDTGLDENSNYFDLYGDSITAVTLIDQLGARFGIVLTQDDIYQHPTPLALARHLMARLQPTVAAAAPLSPVEPLPPLEPAAAQACLNPYQGRFYLLEKMQRGSHSHYNVPLCLNGPVAPDWERLCQALRTVLAAQPSFARCLKWNAGTIELGAPRGELLAAERDELAASADPEPRLTAFFGHRFALESGPAARLLLLHHGAQHYLALNFPHLLIDGVGLENLLRALERALAGQEMAPLAALPARGWGDADLRFWHDRLAGIAPSTLAARLPRSGGSAPQYPAGSAEAVVPPALYGAARAVCRAHSCTPFVLYYAIFNALIAQHSGAAHVLTGTTLNNREGAAVQRIDCRINNLPLHVPVPDSEDYGAILAATASQFSAALQHAAVPLDAIVQAAGGGVPYRLLFMFQNQNDGYRLELDGVPWREAAYRYRPVYGELCFQFKAEAGDGLRLVLHYDPDYHNQADAERLIAAFFALGTRFTHHLLEANSHA